MGARRLNRWAARSRDIVDCCVAEHFFEEPERRSDMAKEQGVKPIAQNKKARHDYAIEDKYEAGLVLTGTVAS